MKLRSLIPIVALSVPVLFAAALSQETAAEPPVEDKRASIEITEWDVPWPDTRPRDPYAVSASEVWFVGQQGDYVARLDPQSGDFERIDLDDGAGPHNLVVAGDGGVWYAGNRAAHIGRVDPGTGEIVKIAMPQQAARDPHTLVFDAAGDIWFTVQGGNFIGKLARETGEVRLVDVPTPRARPYGIKVAADGMIWAVLFGSNKLASIDPRSMTLTEHELPREGARPRRLGLTDDGRIWYVDYAEGMLGVFDPETGGFDEWETPSGSNSRPYGMAIDGQDRIWFVETGVQPNRFVGFDTGEQDYITSTEVPSGGGTVRHMHYHEPTNTIWFGADTNTIGRAALD